MTQRSALVGFLFVCTGATGLVTEQIFEKFLATVLGVSTPAATLVLAVYFVGLTLGAALYGLFRARVSRPLRLYALLEAGVGVMALLLLLFWTPLQNLGSALVRATGDGDAAVFFARLLVAAVLILPSTTLMGATFPTIVGFLRTAMPGVHRFISAFYALNLFGATLAAGFAPYLLFPKIGLTGALIVAIGLQVIVVAGALFIDSRMGAPGEQDAPTVAKPLAALRAVVAHDGGGFVLLLAFLSGLVIFSLEVLWVHLIAVVVGTSVYAFANMLAVVLGALFVGSVLTSVLFAKRASLPSWSLSLVLALAALALGYLFSSWDDAPLAFLDVDVKSFALGELVRVQVILSLLLVPALLLGAVYPLLFRVAWFPSDDADAAAGWIGAVNAIGSFTGALLTGFVLIPLLGSQLTYACLVLAVGSVAIVAALRSREQGRMRFVSLAIAIGAVLLTSLSNPWNLRLLTSGLSVYFGTHHVGPQSELIFVHEDTHGGFTTVARQGENNFTLLTNGKFQGNTSGETAAQSGVSLIPMLHTGISGRALVIGLGTGKSLEFLHRAGFDYAEVADISPGIYAAARGPFREYNGRVLEQPNVISHLEDGRNFLLRTDSRFHLIQIELSSIWFAGATICYSKEFYEVARDRLDEGGVLQQWVQFHHTSAPQWISTISTMRSVFPHVEVYLFGGQGIILGAEEPLRRYPEVVEQLRERGFGEALAMIETIGEDLHGLDDYRVLDDAQTTELLKLTLAAGVPINTDRNRYLEYESPRHNLERIPHQLVLGQQLLTWFPDIDRGRLQNLALLRRPAEALKEPEPPEALTPP